MGAKTITAEIRIPISVMGNILKFQKLRGYIMPSKGACLRRALEDFSAAVCNMMPEEEIFTSDLEALDFVVETLSRIGKGISGKEAGQLGTLISRLSSESLQKAITRFEERRTGV